MTAKKIRKLTGVSKRAQQHIHKNFRNYGTVVKKPLVAGQRHLLTGLEITFIKGCLKQQPDMYFSELQQELKETYHVITSISTIC
ncbi:hypothetical protein CPB85DRAFT_1440957 [Mucidula mucida]|nr:hypothetical protein CPB85DRAFT_1440957 [Mucidula mucida]